MTLEILIAFVAGLLVATLLKDSSSDREPDPVKLLHQAARSGIIIRIAEVNDGGYILSLREDVAEVEKLDREARDLLANDEKRAAIGLIRKKRGMGLKEAKDYVEAL